jgi:hypothetical protein
LLLHTTTTIAKPNADLFYHHILRIRCYALLSKS